jgi:hypothetical protein
MKFRAKNYDLHIVLGATVLVAVTLMFFGGTRELGTNLFTEITGVAITIFVINKILERKERQKRITIDQRILRETQKIIASYFSIWKHLIWKYLPEETITDTRSFSKLYPKLVQLTRLNDQFEIVSIHHPESWKLFFHNRSILLCFENYQTVLTQEIQLFISDFKMYLEPELLNHLLNIMESEYFRNMYMMMQEETNSALVELEQDPLQLESYLAAEEKIHIDHFKMLIDYCVRLRTTIRQFSEENPELYDIEKYFVHPTKTLTPLVTV